MNNDPNDIPNLSHFRVPSNHEEKSLLEKHGAVLLAVLSMSFAGVSVYTSIIKDIAIINNTLDVRSERIENLKSDMKYLKDKLEEIESDRKDDNSFNASSLNRIRNDIINIKDKISNIEGKK